jgi:carboxyl-terminal processing protease
MRAAFLFASLALSASPALAAPAPKGPPAAKDPEKFRDACKAWAQRVDLFAEQVARRHVRAVSREALLEAMVAALYREARRPLPPSLRTRIEAACAEAAPKPGEAPPVVSAREALLTSLRLRLGEVEGLSQRAALEACCKAAIALLDPYSGLMTAEDRRRALGLEQESVGAGLIVTDDTGIGPMVVESVLLGSPGQRAGLRPGDRITHVEGAPVAKAPPAALLALKTKNASTDDIPLIPSDAKNGPKAEAPPGLVRVRFVRPGEAEPRTALVLPARFRVETAPGVRRRGNGEWDYVADEKARLAYVRLVALGRGTAEELRLTLLELRRKKKMRGLVLDLRWCPGGFLNEAVKVAELFLGEATIATVKMRDRPDEVYRSTAGGKLDDFPVVVLVNGETSGGAELIAAALQDHRRALVVGSRTLGKASVQTPVVVAEGLDFKLTTGTFVRPSGKGLHRPADGAGEWGVVPDEDFRVSPDLGRRLKGWWLEFSLLPAGARDRHPLELPGADPQQAAALKALRRQIERGAAATARAG